jgi:hypothetical protein
MVDNQIDKLKFSTMLTGDKVTEIFCITDEFCKKSGEEAKNLKKLPENGIRHRNRPCEMSDSFNSVIQNSGYDITISRLHRLRRGKD